MQGFNIAAISLIVIILSFSVTGCHHPATETRKGSVIAAFGTIDDFASIDTSSSSHDFDRMLKECDRPGSDVYYPKLVSRFQKDDTTLTPFEISALYVGQSQTHEQEAYEGDAIEDTLFHLNELEEYGKCIQIAKRLLQRNPVSISGNLEIAYAFQQLGAKASHDKYLARYYRILDGINSTGTGKTKAEAFVVTSIRDEYMMLRYMRVKSRGQARADDKNGNYYDVLSVSPVAEEGPKQLIYFNVTLHAKKAESYFKEQLNK
jgi:hypothetical protein